MLEGRGGCWKDVWRTQFLICPPHSCNMTVWGADYSEGPITVLAVRGVESRQPEM